MELLAKVVSIALVNLIIKVIYVQNVMKICNQNISNLDLIQNVLFVLNIIGC